MIPKGANLSTDMLVGIGQFLPPKDLVGKMPGICKQWNKVNWKLLYENVTPTKDPIAVFKKIDEEKFFLEDPKNLLDRAINGYTRNHFPTIDFSTATWGNVFEYSIEMCAYLRYDNYFNRSFNRYDYFNRLFSENATEFMKALAINAAQNCPLDFEVWGGNPLTFAVHWAWNDFDVAAYYSNGAL